MSSPYSLRSALSPKRFYRSLMHALRGVQRLFSSTPNATIHAIATVAVLTCGIIFRVTPIEWCLLLLCIGAVLSLEAMNSALEALADHVTQDYAPLIKDAKDLAAGAVLIMSIIAAIVGLLILVPYLCRL